MKSFVTVDGVCGGGRRPRVKGDCFQCLANEDQIQGSVLASFPIDGSSSTKK